MNALLLAVALCGQVGDGRAVNGAADARVPTSVVERLEAAISKLVEERESLSRRVDELEKKLTSFAPSPKSGEILDPEASSIPGGRWMHHPQTGQAVFAKYEWHRYRTPGGSLIIELVRKEGKPVPVDSVVHGDNSRAVASPQDAPAPARRRTARTEVDLDE